MKKSSVLTKRAALFTATVMAVTVAVSLCAGMLGTWIQLSQTTRKQLRPRAEYLARQASGDYNQAGEVIGVEAGDLQIIAKNTILCTSGFAANKDMVAKYIPEMKNA